MPSVLRPFRAACVALLLGLLVAPLAQAQELEQVFGADVARQTRQYLQQSYSPEIAKRAADMLAQHSSPNFRERAKQAGVVKTAADGLARLMKNNRIGDKTLTTLLANRAHAPRMEGTLQDLSRIDNMKGVKPLATRMSKSNNFGEAYEAHVAARFGNRVKELGPTIGGQEVDMVLTDGTHVEIKIKDTSKLSKQLPRYDNVSNGAGRADAPVMVVVGVKPRDVDISMLGQVGESLQNGLEVLHLPYEKNARTPVRLLATAKAKAKRLVMRKAKLRTRTRPAAKRTALKKRKTGEGSASAKVAKDPKKAVKKKPANEARRPTRRVVPRPKAPVRPGKQSAAPPVAPPVDAVALVAGGYSAADYINFLARSGQGRQVVAQAQRRVTSRNVRSKTRRGSARRAPVRERTPLRLKARRAYNRKQLTHRRDRDRQPFSLRKGAQTRRRDR